MGVSTQSTWGVYCGFHKSTWPPTRRRPESLEDTSAMVMDVSASTVSILVVAVTLVASITTASTSTLPSWLLRKGRYETFPHPQEPTPHACCQSRQTVDLGQRTDSRKVQEPPREKSSRH